MIITHASQSKIENVSAFYSDCQRGCLFFAAEGNTYNLAGEVNYQYNLEVEKVLRIKSVNYKHDLSEMVDVFEDMRMSFSFAESLTDEELSELLDETLDISDYDDSAEASWLMQQFQGILAHRLGYDCAESDDEQGTVYIAYCVGRNLVEILSNVTAY